MGKVIFVIPNGQEAELFQAIYEELDRRGYDVLNIETADLCCDKDNIVPSEKLAELEMESKSIYSYKTRNMVRILESESPDVLVIGSDQEYVQRAFAYASKGIGIPVLLVDVAFGSNILKGDWLVIRRSLYRLYYHFFVIVRKYAYILRTVVGLGWGLHKILWMIMRDLWNALVVEDGRGLYGCDKIVVAGEWGREVLLERGIDSSKVVITGNPRMASMLRKRNLDGEQRLREELGVRVDDRIILLQTSAQVEHGRWSSAMRKAFVNKVIDSLKPLLNDGAKLVLRLHPAESLSEYKEIVNGRGDVILRKGTPYMDTIGASDVILFNAYSTMVLEATAIGKPVVLLNTFNEAKNLPYEEMGLAICLYNYDRIEPTVRSLLYDEAFRGKFLGQVKSFYATNKEFVDGKATERIADLIEGMAKDA